MGALTGLPLLFKILILTMVVGSSLGMRLDPKVTAFLARGKKMRGGNEKMDIVIEVEGARRSGSSARNGVKLPSIPSSSSEEERKTGAKAVKNDMVQWAQQSQAGILAKLQNEDEAPPEDGARRKRDNSKPTITTSWITNRVMIRGATASMIDTLCHEKNMNISVIREEVSFEIDSDDAAPTQSELLWHVEKVGAPNFWSLNGTKGEGILMGCIDTGVRGTHETLSHNWVTGPGGWFDPTSNNYSEPHDVGSHGTHALALAVGGKGVGVAPGAKWMACLGCNGRCFEKDLVACGEFMLCPGGGEDGTDCSGIPDIVTNSWGTTKDNVRWYDAVIEAWRDVGIIPIFAAGNRGGKPQTKCSTLASPCDNPDVICVGATTVGDALAGFSSIGPSSRNPEEIKPDITAPGDSIRSAVTGHDSDYGVKSGTSMATPIVSGGVALLLSNWKQKKIEYSFDKVKDWITRHAVKSGLAFNGPDDLLCHGKSYSEIPNDFFGYGRFSLDNYAEDEDDDAMTHNNNEADIMSISNYASKNTHFVTITLIILVSKLL